MLPRAQLLEKTQIKFNSISFTLRGTRKGLFFFGYGRTDIMPDEFDYLKTCFELWVKSPLYLTFYNPETKKLEYHRAMKRGNTVYAYKLKKRIEACSKFFTHKLLVREVEISPNGARHKPRPLKKTKFISNVLFVTLTWNPKLYAGNRMQAWENVASEYNNFITKMRQQYGDLWVFRTLEATANGYPHIHLLIVAKKPFEVFEHKGEYRAREKNKISKMWPAFVDVKAPYNLKSMKNYLTKDLFKQIYMKTPQATLSLAFNWLFRKRAYAISKGKMIADLIDGLSIIQIKLDGQIKEKTAQGLVFCGFVVIREYRGTPPPEQFSCELSKAEFDELFVTISKPSEAFIGLARQRGYTDFQIDSKLGFV